jgi:TRAP-type C4-dicarboxylate transport system permease small subunit
VKKLDSASRVLSNICSSVAAAIMLLITALVFAEAISRYVFGVSHEWVPPASSWMMVWMTYFILGVALKGREHINVDILQTRLPPGRRLRLLTYFDIITLIFAIVLCAGGIQYDLMVKDSNIHVVTVQAVPVWLMRISVPLGAVFLAFFSLEHLIRDIYGLSRHSGEAGKSAADLINHSEEKT